MALKRLDNLLNIQTFGPVLPKALASGVSAAAGNLNTRGERGAAATPDPMAIVGMSGKMGVGKNHLAEKLLLPMLAQRFGPGLPVAFADHLKVTAAVKHCLSMDEVLEATRADVRLMLQREGTEHGRARHGDDIWVQYLRNWMTVHKTRGVCSFVITDVRFRNEVEFIRELGGKVIRISAPGRNAARVAALSNGDLARHASETELDSYERFDLVLNNDFHADQRRIAQQVWELVAAM